MMFHAIVSLLLAVVTLNIVSTFGTNQHLICKSVDDVFSDASSPSHTRTAPRILHGTQGKRGPKGVKGERGSTGFKGEKGTPGFVDPRNIENIVEQKCRQANSELTQKIVKLEEAMAKMNSSITGITDQLPTICEKGFSYGRKCYFAIIHSVRDVRLPDARSLCSQEGGTPADILNHKHEELAADHVRSVTTLIGSPTFVWLGMSYTHSTSTLRWSTGIKVPDDLAASLRWWDRYPSSNSGWDKVPFGVSSSTFGIYNLPSANQRNGVLCQK